MAEIHALQPVGGPPDDEPPPRGRLAPTPFFWTEPQSLPKREWLYGRHLIRRYVSTTIAPGGLGKSSLLIAESLAMATGKPLLGEYVPRPLRVWYWNGEDGQDENRYRMVACASHYKIDPAEFQHNLWHDTGREKEILIASNGREGYAVNGLVVAEITDHILERGIDVLIIDPFVAAHAVSENDNGAINAVVRAFARVAEFGNCAVELVHHIRKPGAGVKFDTDVNDARGASALIGGVRSARVLNAMDEDEAERLKIKNRRAYFRVDNGKANLAPPAEAAVWRRIVSYDLGNYDENDQSDTIGVVTKWELPGIFEGTPSNALVVACRILGATAYRYDSRSEEWAGYAIASSMEIDVSKAAGKKQMGGIIDRWIEAGALSKFVSPDRNRVARTYVRVVNPPDDEAVMDDD